MSTLEDVGGDLPDALEAINVPSYAIDPSGIIRWLNPAAERIVGDCCGRQFTSVVAAEHTRRAREHFARKVAGNERVTDTETVLVPPDGTPVALAISPVPLREDHRVVAIFGQLSDVPDVDDRPPH